MANNSDYTPEDYTKDFVTFAFIMGLLTGLALGILIGWGI